jgi:quinol monooxygenase YgiN
MEFIQILEFRTSKIDRIRAMDDEWRQATDGKRTLRRSLLCQDRNDKNRHLVIAFFDSPESAQVNSDLPATAAFANQVNAVVDAPLAFQDLDVIEDRT